MPSDTSASTITSQSVLAVTRAVRGALAATPEFGRETYPEHVLVYSAGTNSVACHAFAPLTALSYLPHNAPALISMLQQYRYSENETWHAVLVFLHHDGTPDRIEKLYGPRARVFDAPGTGGREALEFIAEKSSIPDNGTNFERAQRTGATPVAETGFRTARDLLLLDPGVTTSEFDDFTLIIHADSRLHGAFAWSPRGLIPVHLGCGQLVSQILFDTRGEMETQWGGFAFRFRRSTGEYRIHPLVHDEVEAVDPRRRDPSAIAAFVAERVFVRGEPSPRTLDAIAKKQRQTYLTVLSAVIAVMVLLVFGAIFISNLF